LHNEIEKKSIKKGHKKTPELTNQIRDPTHEVVITSKKAKIKIKI